MSESNASGRKSRRVTVVVPVYGDWESLWSCVQSLFQHADPATYDVLLVNDSGPDADEIESGLRGMIFGRANYRYERNPQNLGFVQTCNRAVSELDDTDNDILLLNSDTVVTEGALDELRTVLSLSDFHATVCPRSNDATIATIPFFRRSPGTAPDPERSYAVFQYVAPQLPRFYIAPVSVGFCMLIRRDLIEKHGLFDPIFGKGYNEENDLCLRLNAIGYSSAIANRAYVYHVGSSSFGKAQRDALEATNAAILHDRYPFYPGAVTSFIKDDYAPADRFADVLFPPDGDDEPTVLVDLHPTTLDTSQSDRVLSTLSHLAALPDLADRITLAAYPADVDRHNLSRFGFRVIAYSTLDEVFDIGVSLSPVTDVEQLAMLNRRCLRWAVRLPDKVAQRSWERRTASPQAGVALQRSVDCADFTFPASTGDTDLWAQVQLAGRQTVDPSALIERDRAIRELALVSDPLREALVRATDQIAIIENSGSYALARRFSKVTAPIAGLVRRRRRTRG